MSKLEDYFKTESLAELQLKGISRPVTAYNILTLKIDE
jgi:hypothetical protein